MAIEKLMDDVLSQLKQIQQQGIFENETPRTKMKISENEIKAVSNMFWIDCDNNTILALID